MFNLLLALLIGLLGFLLAMAVGHTTNRPARPISSEEIPFDEFRNLYSHDFKPRPDYDHPCWQYEIDGDNEASPDPLPSIFANRKERC